MGQNYIGMFSWCVDNGWLQRVDHCHSEDYKDPAKDFVTNGIAVYPMYMYV